MKKLAILVDNDSWILPYAEKLKNYFLAKKHTVKLCRSHQEIEEGFALFLLGCIHILPSEALKKYKHTLVVHESDLPQGKGFAPMAWQILEGKNEIPICLLEASEHADSGDLWVKDIIKLEGNELSDEWRYLQGEKTIELCKHFMENYDQLKPTPQVGKESHYPRRRPKDSQLDISLSLKDQFQLLRIVDNETYPAFFEIDGMKYKLMIQKL